MKGARGAAATAGTGPTPGARQQKEAVSKKVTFQVRTFT